MATGAFERLAKSVLRRLGQDALLISGATVTPCRVNIEHGVQVTGSFNDAVFERDVATFDTSEVTPTEGNTLEHPAGRYRLDSKMQDVGVLVRYTLVKQ